MGKKKDTKNIRIVELLLVLFVAFAIPLLAQVAVFEPGPRQKSSVSVFISMVHMISAVAVLAYVLFRQGKTFRDIGLSARWRDVPVSLLLMVIGLILSACTIVVLDYLSYLVTGEALAHRSPPAPSLNAGVVVAIGGFIWFLMVPFYEEIIVRAYTISELLALSGNAALAVGLSVTVQCAYHLYQGLPAAISHAGPFLVCALYYLKTRRALPAILAHLNHNILVVLLGALR